MTMSISDASLPTRDFLCAECNRLRREIRLACETLKRFEKIETQDPFDLAYRRVSIRASYPYAESATGVLERIRKGEV